MTDQERRRRRPAPPVAEDLREQEEESPVKDLEDAYDDMRQRVLGMFDLPDDFKRHMRAARREVLLAVRSLIDARITDLEELEKRQDAGRRSRVHIE